MDGFTREVTEGGAGPLARAIARTVGWATIGEPARIFTTLGRHRRLFRVWLPFAATLLFRTRLPRPDAEVVILRTACNCASAYEWAQHVALARRAGLDAGTIAAIADRSDEHALSVRQRLLLDAVDDLHAHDVVSSGTWERLRGVLDEEELLEVCFLTGHYKMLAMTLNSVGLTPEPRALAALSASERETAMRLRPTPRG